MVVSIGCVNYWVGVVLLIKVGDWVDDWNVLAAATYVVRGGVGIFDEIIEGIAKNLHCVLGVL